MASPHASSNQYHPFAAVSRYIDEQCSVIAPVLQQKHCIHSFDM